jgi:lipopolysaccharide transport system permease protein
MTATHSKRTNVLVPPGRWSALELGDLWRYRDLIYILAWRDVKVRYKQALLGGVWALIQPVMMMAIFTLLFQRIARLPVPGVPYPVFAFVGLVPWTLFQNAVTSSSDSLVSNAPLVSKVHFPRLAIPTGAASTWVPDFAISSALLFAIMGLYGVVPKWTAILLPLVLIATLLAALSIGVWLSALNVAYRDVRYIIPFVIQVWLFITPVAYPSTAIPTSFRWLAWLNPMSWVVDFARWALLGTAVSWSVMAFSAATTAVLLITGLYHFRRVEHFFADVI